LKKVFKCPHCSFWAATASRFHVHIVGHLNRKPFECSLCAYRSNWRWDITKHIRLKALRDRSHNQAQVLMNDETGRRNYAKYNQYLTMMKVSAEQLADSKGMRTGEMIVMPPEKLDDHHPMETEEIIEMVDSAHSTSALDLRKPRDDQTEDLAGNSDELPQEGAKTEPNLEPLSFKSLNSSQVMPKPKGSPMNLTKTDGGQSDETTSADESNESD